MHRTGGSRWAVGTPDPLARLRETVRTSGSPDKLLLHLIDGCLLSLLFVAPLLMGGRHPVGQFAWMVIASVLGLATLLYYRPAKPSAGDYIWLAAAVLVILQLIPMPASLLTWLNPGLSELLPGLIDPASLPFGEAIYTDRPISINPYRTRLALGMLLAYGVIFHSVTRRVQTTADVRRLLGWIATATVAIAILALAQRFAGNGKFLWVYQHISRDASDVVKGPFQNQNHLAQLMALGLGPLLYFATSRSGQGKTILATSGATLCLLTGLLTFSRGGAIAMATAGLVACAGLAYAGHVNRHRWLRLVLPTLITVGMLGIWGGEKLLTQVETLSGGSDLASVAPARLELWRSHLKAIAASPWVGYGAASHEDIYPAFIEKDFGVKFTHGESGYLPIQLENGLVGTALLLAALLLTARGGWNCLRRPTIAGATRPVAETDLGKRRVLAVVCLAGLASSAVQSAGDFVWYIPACLTPTLIIVACLYRLASVSTPSGSPASDTRPPRQNAPWLAVPVTILIVALTWSIGPARTSGHWNAYRTLNDDSGVSGDDTSTHLKSLSLLQSIHSQDPENPIVRLRLAKALLSVADGLDSAAKKSKAALLKSAIIQCIAGLRRAPLRGEGYMRLSDAYRRAGAAGEPQLALLEQALRVRPTDTDLRFQAGLTALRGGNPGWGLKRWVPIMETPSEKRNQILRTLSGLLPAEILLQSFSLDYTGLGIIYDHHKNATPAATHLLDRIANHLVTSLIQAANHADDPIESAALLHSASCVVHETKGLSAQTVELALRAVEASPADFRYRLRLANLLIRANRLEEARAQLRWCRSRKPLDPHVARQEKLLTEATRHR